MRIIDNLCEYMTQASMKQVLENSSCTYIMELFEVYVKFLGGGNGNLSTFWLSYMDMIDILLGLIRACGERSWPRCQGVGLRTLESWVRYPHWAWFAFEA